MRRFLLILDMMFEHDQLVLIQISESTSVQNPCFEYLNPYEVLKSTRPFGKFPSIN